MTRSMRRWAGSHRDENPLASFVDEAFCFLRRAGVDILFARALGFAQFCPRRHAPNVSLRRNLYYQKGISNSASPVGPKIPPPSDAVGMVHSEVCNSAPAVTLLIGGKKSHPPPKSRPAAS